MGQTGEGVKHQKPSVGETRVEMKLEVQMIPVSDVERSKQFYERLGWRSDADLTPATDTRIVQFTPPGSGCSVIFGKGITTSFPPEARLSGPDPKRTSYGSFCSFKDPDGNMWIVQEVTTRLPGRI